MRGNKGRGGGGGRKVNVEYQDESVPKFIRDLRAKHGLKSRKETEQEKVNAKFDTRDPSAKLNDFLDVAEEEQPTVVVMGRGDLTMEEAEKAIRGGAKGGEGILAVANKKQGGEEPRKELYSMNSSTLKNRTSKWRKKTGRIVGQDDSDDSDQETKGDEAAKEGENTGEDEEAGHSRPREQTGKTTADDRSTRGSTEGETGRSDVAGDDSAQASKRAKHHSADAHAPHSHHDARNQGDGKGSSSDASAVDAKRQRKTQKKKAKKKKLPKSLNKKNATLLSFEDED